MEMMMSIMGGMAKGGGVRGNFGGGGGKSASGYGGRTAQSTVAAFIAENGIDERGSETLMQCPPDVQQQVMARGSLLDARNPNAALMGRIRDASKGGTALS